MERGALLERLNEELGGTPRTWSEVVIVRNIGPVAAQHAPEGDQIFSRGFNAVLVDKRGIRSHYLKGRPVSHGRSAREAAVQSALSEHAIGRRFIPPTKAFVSGPMRILAMEWVDGDRFDTILRAPGRGVAWKDQVGGLLEDSRDLWTAFDEVLGGESDSGSGELRQTWESAFSTLTKIGLDERTADSLTGRVSQLTLPSVPQHGDLWPRNIMRGENRWWFMDFETCGEVSFPLYDVFHLLRGAARFAPGRGRRSWLRRLAEDEAHLPSLQRSLRGQAQGLTSKQVEGALICYLADFSCRLHKRGISPKKIAPWLKGLAALPEFLEKKGVGDVLLGGAAGTRSSVRGG